MGPSPSPSRRPPEPDDAAPGVPNGKYDATAEPVVNAAPIIAADQARFQQRTRRAGAGRQGLLQAIPSIGREADAEILGHGTRQAAGLEIVDGRLRTFQLLAENRARPGA